MSHIDLLYKSLDRAQAKKLLARFLTLYRDGKAFLHITEHFKKRCLTRNANINDAVNVMKAGAIIKQGEPDLKTGQAVYNVETAQMAITFQFIDENRIRLITIKRK